MNIVIIIVSIVGVIVFTLKLINLIAGSKLLNQFSLFQNKISEKQLAFYYVILVLLFLQILSRYL